MGYFRRSVDLAQRQAFASRVCSSLPMRAITNRYEFIDVGFVIFQLDASNADNGISFWSDTEIDAKIGEVYRVLAQGTPRRVRISRELMCECATRA